MKEKLMKTMYSLASKCTSQLTLRDQLNVPARCFKDITK